MKMEKIWTREVGNNPNLIDLFNFHSPKLASLKKDFLSISIHFVLLEMFGAELQGLRREHQRWEGPPAKQPHVTIGFRKGQHKPYLDGVEALKPRHDCTSNSNIVHI